MSTRFDPGALRAFSEDVLRAAGLAREPAEAVARGLVEADLLGHDTHGLALLADYVEEIDTGAMAAEGRPAVLADLGAIAVWDARRLPGIWTTELALTEACARADHLGLGAIALQRSHHIACLAAFLEAPARAGKLVLVFSSDPSDAHVAPHGGLAPVMTPNPIAAGIPTSGDPILIDISTSITTAAMCARTRAEGGRLKGNWLVDRAGGATDDPQVLKEGGAILPIGGLDHGHKGFALGLLVEALTQGLSGYGRADDPTQWGAAVLVLAVAIERLGGLEAFHRQTDWLAAASRAVPVRPGEAKVRLPGEAGLMRKARSLREGLALAPAIGAGLAALARRFNIAAPEPLDGKA